MKYQYHQYGGAVDTNAEVKKVVDAIQVKLKEQFDDKFVAEISPIPEMKEQYDLLITNMSAVGMAAQPIASDPIQMVELLNRSIDTIVNTKAILDGSLKAYKTAQETLKHAAEMVKSGATPPPPTESPASTPAPKPLTTTNWLQIAIVFLALFLFLSIIVFTMM